EELETKYLENPTLKKAFQDGMQFYFATRTQYRDKTNSDFIEFLQNQFGDFYLIPEGGTNEFAIKGCEEILTETDQLFDYICCAVGTGGTISGIINASYEHQKVLGFPALKGDFLFQDIKKWIENDRWDLVTDYHFGGYAKINITLKQFMHAFSEKYLITLDPVYTSKMFFGVFDLISKGYFKPYSKILLIHTGGLQGLQSNIAEI
ncbi:MAG TPA: pyridoxal-phosphate dependent enzyme, partial [Flavobacterium sp.]|nr:pyridoxal-phosphate dependent enzyme [Flavobacterium sp.]